MPFALTGPPADAAAQLIAHWKRIGVLDESGNVAREPPKFQRRDEDASYEEAQSRLRMSTLCKDCARELDYPLPARIVELAISAHASHATPTAIPGEPCRTKPAST